MDTESPESNPVCQLFAPLDGLPICDALAGDRKSGFELGVAGDLATDVAVQPAEPRAQLPHPAHCLLVAASVDQPRDVAPRAATDAQERLARSEAHTSELQSIMRISYAVFCLKKKK